MNYTNRKWRSKRSYILMRDRYMCHECSRFGRTNVADTVHHIYEVGKYEELRYTNWNLVSLCHKCHNKMHNRETDELNEKGLQWQQIVRKEYREWSKNGQQK